MKPSAARDGIAWSGNLLMWWTVVLFVGLIPSHLRAQVIDFETLPDGTPTTDEQTISDQYAAYGVTFELLDRVTGEQVGLPRIAKAGPPRTAFAGCYDADLPLSGQSLGTAFLTDNTAIGVAGDLLIRYSPPVTRTSGVILDIDCRTNGGPPCEQWTATARDASGKTLATVVLDGPPGDPNPECELPNAGPGESLAFTWSFDLPGQEIHSVLLRYTGEPEDVGLAFDNFSIASLPGPLETTVTGPANESCAGQSVELLAETSGGFPPYAYQWQEENSPGVWTDLGTERFQVVSPGVTTNYRVRATDDQAQTSTSDPLEVSVTSGSGEPACDGRLLVSSYDTDRVLRYDPVAISFVDTFIGEASGGLDGPSGLGFGLDGYLFVVSQRSHSILRFDGATGDFVDVFVPGGSGGLSWPVGLAVGSDGDLYVSSSETDSIKRYDGQTGEYLGDFVAPHGGGLDTPTGLIFGADDRLYVCSRGTDSVKRYDGQTGAYVDDFVAAGTGGLSQPRGLAFGPGGDLYVGSQVSDDVKRYDGVTGEPLGRFVAAGSGTLDRSNDLLFGRAGNLFVISSDNDKLLHFGGLSGEFIDGFPTGNGLDFPSFMTATEFCGDGLCDAGIAEDPCGCETDCGPASGTELTCGDGRDDDCDGLIDCADGDCAAAAACSPAGSVPDGHSVPGPMLALEKAAGEQITLHWAPSCRSSDTDYEVYEGWIGSFASHLPLTCTTGGALSWTFTPSHGHTYYLVTPTNTENEGSYGQDSAGTERSQSTSACLAQIVGACD